MLCNRINCVDSTQSSSQPLALQYHPFESTSAKNALSQFKVRIVADKEVDEGTADSSESLQTKYDKEVCFGSILVRSGGPSTQKLDSIDHMPEYISLQ